MQLRDHRHNYILELCCVIVIVSVCVLSVHALCMIKILSVTIFDVASFSTGFELCSYLSGQANSCV